MHLVSSIWIRPSTRHAGLPGQCLNIPRRANCESKHPFVTSLLLYCVKEALVVPLHHHTFSSPVALAEYAAVY